MKVQKLRGLAVLLVLVMCLAMITGCAHTHKWVDADCTNPKSCSSCDATEGEPLGHQLTEATYQSPALCTVCGEFVGEPLTPDFVTHAIETDIASVGDSAPYITITGNNTAITGVATLTSYEIVPSYREVEAREGYECRVSIFDVQFGPDALTYGAATAFYVTDYYNATLFAENIDHSNPVYSVATVNFNGENCPVYVSQSGEFNAEDGALTLTLAICVQVPIGYDGSVAGIVNAGACQSMDNILDYYRPENFVLFRMGN